MSKDLEDVDLPTIPIKIIYYDNTTYEYIANKLKTIFLEKDLLKYFEFQKVESFEELQ